MTVSIPTTEPTALRAGDTWAWRREDLSDYPAPDWTLKYYFRNAAAKFDVTAAADGAAHAVSVAKANTGKTVGFYDWIAVVESSTERFEIAQGVCEILPNLATDAVYDARSFARKMLAAIEAALLGEATANQLNILEGEFAGRRLKFDRANLTALRDKYRAEVAAEVNALRIKQGKGSRNHLMVRFT
jgi:hypothetical protein